MRSDGRGLIMITDMCNCTALSCYRLVGWKPVGASSLGWFSSDGSHILSFMDWCDRPVCSSLRFLPRPVVRDRDVWVHPSVRSLSAFCPFVYTHHLPVIPRVMIGDVLVPSPSVVPFAPSYAVSSPFFVTRPVAGRPVRCVRGWVNHELVLIPVLGCVGGVFDVVIGWKRVTRWLASSDVRLVVDDAGARYVRCPPRLSPRWFLDMSDGCVGRLMSSVYDDFDGSPSLLRTDFRALRDPSYTGGIRHTDSLRTLVMRSGAYRGSYISGGVSRNTRSVDVDYSPVPFDRDERLGYVFGSSFDFDDERGFDTPADISYDADFSVDTSAAAALYDPSLLSDDVPEPLCDNGDDGDDDDFVPADADERGVRWSHFYRVGHWMTGDVVTDVARREPLGSRVFTVPRNAAVMSDDDAVTCHRMHILNAEQESRLDSYLSALPRVPSDWTLLTDAYPDCKGNTQAALIRRLRAFGVECERRDVDGKRHMKWFVRSSGFDIPRSVRSSRTPPRGKRTPFSYPPFVNEVVVRIHLGYVVDLTEGAVMPRDVRFARWLVAHGYPLR